MPEIIKENRIDEELKRISHFFENAAASDKAIIAPLLQNAAFMRITLENLQVIINEEGPTEVYQNGEHQKGIKQSAALQSYNSTIKNYASVIKTLVTFLPPEQRKITASSLYNMVEEDEETEEERQQRFQEAADEAAAVLRYWREKESTEV